MCVEGPRGLGYRTQGRRVLARSSNYKLYNITDESDLPWLDDEAGTRDLTMQRSDLNPVPELIQALLRVVVD